MRNVFVFVIVICSALHLALAQIASDKGAVTTVLALEHAWNQAEQVKDTRALDAIFDNSLVYIDYDGTFRTKAEFLGRLRSQASHPQQEITESMTAHTFGSGTVIVTGVYVAKGSEKGKPYVRRGRFVDTWTFTDGKWLCVASQATPILR